MSRTVRKQTDSWSLSQATTDLIAEGGPVWATDDVDIMPPIPGEASALDQPAASMSAAHVQPRLAIPSWRVPG